MEIAITLCREPIATDRMKAAFVSLSEIQSPTMRFVRWGTENDGHHWFVAAVFEVEPGTSIELREHLTAYLRGVAYATTQLVPIP